MAARIWIAYMTFYFIAVWAMWGRHRMFRDRIRIAEKIRERSDLGSMTQLTLVRLCDAVPERTHVWRRMTFRDPFVVYPKPVRDVIAGNTKLVTFGDRQ